MAHEAVKLQERSLGDLFSELAGETGTLVRQELALAQAEMTKKASRVGTNVGSLVVGGAIAYAGALALLAGVILGLAHFMPAWLAAILVGAVVGVIAFFMISSALTALKNTEFTPTETVESIKEDAQWLKNQVT